MKLSNFGQRVLTGTIFVAVLLGGILLSKHSFFALFSIILILSLVEFYGLICRTYKVKLNKPLNILGGILFYVGSYICFSSGIASILAFVPFLIWLVSIFVVELYAKKENPIQSLAYTFLGLIYIALPLGAVSYLAFSYEPNTYHYAYLLALFVFIWVNDSFAYLIGSLLGKHRLFERISPKKSWEGFIGGAFFSIGSSLIFAHFFQNQNTWVWMGFACVVVILGTLGDLFESLFKRILGVKDSGDFLPGHGGMLDRFDSMLFSIIPIIIYLEIVGFLSK